MRLLEVSSRSEEELFRRLLAAGYGPTEAEDAVQECVRRGYVNDPLFAADLTQLNLQRGSGRRKIRQKLIQKGFDREMIEQTLEEYQDAEPESARTALEQKWRLLSRESDPRKKRAKAFRFLVGRGFPAALAAELIDEIRTAEKEGSCE